MRRVLGRRVGSRLARHAEARRRWSSSSSSSSSSSAAAVAGVNPCVRLPGEDVPVVPHERSTIGYDDDGNPMIRKIILTGGPCGGKSTALVALADHVRSFGFDVYTVPEAATIMINAGATFLDCSPDQLITMQSELIGIQTVKWYMMFDM